MQYHLVGLSILLKDLLKMSRACFGILKPDILAIFSTEMAGFLQGGGGCEWAIRELEKQEVSQMIILYTEI